MRKQGHRSRAVVAVLTAALVGVAGCDAVGGDAAGPTPKAKPSPKPAPAWDSSPASIAAVGDSITRGFDACGVLTDCPDVSWATGSSTQVDSLAVRLLGRTKAAGRSWNHAVSGARMADLSPQMAQAAAHGPELVTVMVGANDACRDSTAAMTPVSDFRAGFEDALGVLRKRAPKAQVYVASVPNLKRLWSQGRANPLGKQVWKLGVCPSMLADADAVDPAATERRDTVQKRVEAYNLVLKQVCAKDERCRYDGGAVYDYRFGTDQLSHWDWFHPSVNGQARLAEIAYRRISSVS
ncbi:lysophospholipase L1-like esterase [Streptomyces canus]|uniref:SGNH/GDSL hydrolase family protein n=1 Tax=Streptomyces sp. WSLK1-3 TaxID=3375475 RepID=UPI0037ADEF08